MKKLITFFIAIWIAGALSAQLSNTFKYVINANGDVHTPLGNLMNMQTGVFNVLDYGAISNDGIEDATAIQSAINAASAYGNGVEGWGGRVDIPAGNWYITKPDTLKSWVHIKVDKAARFYFPDNYTGSMWVLNGTTLVGTWVEGGYYFGTTYKHKIIDITATQGNYMLFCKFSDMYMYNGSTSISLVTSGIGWINGNTFLDMVIFRSKIGIYTLRSVTSEGLDGNFFININIQAGDSMQYGIKNLSGYDNTFSNLGLYDFSVTQPSSATVTISSDGRRNILEGFGIKGKNYVDAGIGNYIRTEAHLWLPDSLIINADGTSSDRISKFKIIGAGSDNDLSSPGGDVGLKITANGGAGLADWTENRSIRIVARNMSASNFGSVMALQTHIAASNTSNGYIDALKLDHLGNAVFYGSATVGTQDTTVAKAYGKIVFKASDSTLYVCRFIRPTGKKCWFPLN